MEPERWTEDGYELTDADVEALYLDLWVEAILRGYRFDIN